MLTYMFGTYFKTVTNTEIRSRRNFKWCSFVCRRDPYYKT